MFARLLAVCLAVPLLLAACDDKGKDESRQASICKGLSETDCAGNSECKWSAKKGKCKTKKAGDKTETTRLPPSPTDQSPPSEPTPPSQTEQIPQAEPTSPQQ